MNDTYYSHAKDAQSQALDDEAEAYEKAMNKFIEGLRESLKVALQDMDGFMEGVFNAVILNAPAITEQYNNLGISLDSAIIDPWTEAAAEITKFGGVDGLGIMNSWITEGGVIYSFDTEATKLLQSPWTAGQNAVKGFQTSVASTMKQIVSNVSSNISKAAGKISSLYSQIKDTEKKAKQSYDNINKYTNEGNKTPKTEPIYYITATVTALGKTFTETAASRKSEADAKSLADSAVRNAAVNYMQDTKYDSKTALREAAKLRVKFSGAKTTYAAYAKGTLGTKKDEWAITDESWIGEEITLAAGKNGQLQYLKKGSAVMPADISANLVEWGKLDPNMMNIGGVGANLNMISNAVVQPNYEFNFDSLVHVDHCDEGTLKNLEKMVDTKINDFSRQLNYSIKKFAR